jgi:predicted Rossmann fold nucleotide-binding protein DprA/Smf involved in DNA uptake
MKSHILALGFADGVVVVAAGSESGKLVGVGD